MTQIYRTTKIPVFYFKQIEEYLSSSEEFVSVSEFIRDSIKEKLFKISQHDYSLIAKQVVFNEEAITKIHESIIFETEEKNKAKPYAFQSIINKSEDMDFIKFLSRFLVNFALIHPFEDGNKRTSWIAVDVFLRLSNKKLELNAQKENETKDELFIWQNSTSQKTIPEVYDFIKSHIITYKNNSNEFLAELEKSIKENDLLLEKLSR